MLAYLHLKDEFFGICNKLQPDLKCCVQDDSRRERRAETFGKVSRKGIERNCRVLTPAR